MWIRDKVRIFRTLSDFSNIVNYRRFCFWHFLVYDSPQQHPRISDDEKNYILDNITGPIEDEEKTQIPWRSIFLSRPVWVTIAAHWGIAWGFFTLMTQAPTYFNFIHGWNINAVSFVQFCHVQVDSVLNKFKFVFHFVLYSDHNLNPLNYFFRRGYWREHHTCSEWSSRISSRCWATGYCVRGEWAWRTSGSWPPSFAPEYKGSSSLLSDSAGVIRYSQSSSWWPARRLMEPFPPPLWRTSWTWVPTTPVFFLDSPAWLSYGPGLFHQPSLAH